MCFYLIILKLFNVCHYHYYCSIRQIYVYHQILVYLIRTNFEHICTICIGFMPVFSVNFVLYLLAVNLIFLDSAPTVQTLFSAFNCQLLQVNDLQLRTDGRRYIMSPTKSSQRNCATPKTRTYKLEFHRPSSGPIKLSLRGQIM